MKTIILGSTLLILSFVFKNEPFVAIEFDKEFENSEMSEVRDTDVKVPISGHYEIWDGCTVNYDGYVTINIEKEKITHVSVGISLAGEGCGEYNGLEFGASWGVNSISEDGKLQIKDLTNSKVTHSIGNDSQLQQLLIDDINRQL